MHNDDIIILDGGMGQELYRRGCHRDELLWAAKPLISNPDMVRDIHIDFINAGAQVVTTNTYSTKPGRLRRVGMDDNQIAELNRIACDMAMQARDKVGKPDVKIAASIPPQYSYRPDIEIDETSMRDDYEEMVALLNPYVDLFLCETMTDAREARAAASVCAATGKAVWCSWTLKDDGSGLLRNNKTIEETLREVSDLTIDAYLVNCCPPETVTEAIRQMSAHAYQQMIGGYANGFTHIPEKWKPGHIAELGVRRDLTPETYVEYVKEWISHSAMIIGGCCEITPAHIHTIHGMLGRQ